VYTVGAPGVCIQDNNLYLNIFTVGFSASRFFKFISISGIIEKTVYFQNLRFFSLGTRIHAYSMSNDWRKGKASRRPSHGRYHCPHMAYTNLFIWKLSSSWFCHLVRAFPRDLYIFWTNVNRRRYYRVRRFWHQAPGRWAYPAYRCRQQSGYAQSCRNYAKSPFTRESIGNHYSVGSEVRLFGAIHVQRSLILSLVSTPGGFGNVSFECRVFYTCTWTHVTSKRGSKSHLALDPGTVISVCFCGPSPDCMTDYHSRRRLWWDIFLNIYRRSDIYST